MKRIAPLLTAALLMMLTACLPPTSADSDESEPNDSFATANELTGAGTYDAQISPVGDEDYFVVVTTSDTTVTATASDDIDIYVYLYDENQNQIGTAHSETYGGTGEYVASAAEFGSRFYIFVEDAYGDSYTGAYTITLE